MHLRCEVLCNLWWWPLNLLRSWLICKLVWNPSWFHGLPGYTGLSLLNRLCGGWFSYLISYNWSVMLHSPTLVIYCDNVSATYVCANPVFHSRMKRIAIDFHFVRDQVATGKLHISNVHTSDQQSLLSTRIRYRAHKLLKTKMYTLDLIF
jgi:hypothetical protein